MYCPRKLYNLRSTQHHEIVKIYIFNFLFWYPRTAVFIIMLGWYWGDVYNLIFLLEFVQILGLGLHKSPYKNIKHKGKDFYCDLNQPYVK